MTEPIPKTEMPFLDHLEELRWRLVRILGAFLVGVVIAFTIVLKFGILRLLQKPIAPYLAGRKLVYTNPGDPFAIMMSTSFTLGAILALPVIVWQIWAFLSPALYKHEKKVVIPVLVGATLLFLVGVCMAYFLVLPMTLRMLIGIQSEAFEPMITASGYFGFAMTMALAFGAIFELPIVIVALTALGLVNPTMLARYRRFALVGSYVAAAFVTPGDMFLTSIAVTGPLYLLYELSILLSAIVYRRRQQRIAPDVLDAGVAA